MGCCKKKKVKGRNGKAASSLAPSDKYHKNPQEGHRRITTSTTSSEGGGETSNNNRHFSHNGIPPPFPSSSSSGATENVQQRQQQQYDDQLMQSSSYHFYPTNSVGSSSISLSSHQPNNHPQQQLQPQLQQPLALHQPPYLYKSNRSSSGGSFSGNGSHIIIDGSNNSNGAGSAVEGNDNKKYYYYYNGHYYPTTTAAAAGEEEDPEQIFTITAFTSGSGSGKQIIMGRVGEDMYPPGSPASIGKGNVAGTGLFKSKSSSIPVTSGSPQPHHRGFRDTFISSMSPPVQVHSAESSPLHRSASAATANGSERYSVNSSGNNKQENKKWSFGGLFRRNKSKSTAAAAASAGNNNSIVVENGGASSANNSHCNSPAKINNNYGGGSPIIIPTRNTSYSPARPASSVGFISVDPHGHSIENHHHHRQSTILSSSTPKFVNAESQTRAKGKLSESDISTCDSDFELHELPHHHDNPPEPAPQENKGYKQNFLVRRLSRRKEKAAAKKAAAAAQAVSVSASASPKTGAASASNHQLHHNSSNGFISSHQQQQHGGGGGGSGCLDVPQMKRRVGSSPDSLNNSSEPWPSWEMTKKPQTQLQALQQQHRLLQNYSSNGSLSVSQEGYNSNNNSSNNHGGKSSRAAAREAVKARAIARRESFLHDSSSSDDDTEERSQRSSLQGSFSSLNSRNRRQKAFNMQQAQFQQQRHLFPATTQAAGGISCASPSSPMPVPLDYRNSTGAIATAATAAAASGMSPNMNRRLMMMGAPGSPKWEPRVIYQQQDGESSQPVVVRLPRKERMSSGGGGGVTTATTGNPSQMSQNNGDQSFIMATEMISEDQHVVTAGLKVPFLPVQNQQTQQHQDQQCLRNGQLMFPDDPVQYANVTNGMRGRSCTPYLGYSNGAAGGGGGAIHHASPTPPPPPPPRRDFTTATNNPNFYRPVSCSFLDSYANQLQMSEHQHHQQIMRQQSPMVFNGNYIYSPQQQQHQQLQYQGQQQEFVMNGFASHSTNPAHNLDGARGIARSSPRHFVPAATAKGNNNQPDVDGSRHPPLIRSPSEPPIIRAEQTRISSPVKRLISSPMSNGSNGESHEGKSSPSAAGKNVITSKLGFPVRRLQETSKLAGPQGPVHLRASEFWRKKETEAGSPSPVGGNGAITNSQQQQQKKYLNRIRSADSSPLPVPKMRKSPGGVVASNESISSLSSFSENAASPGPPKNCSSPITSATKQGQQKQQHHHAAMKATPIRAHISKTPNPQQLTYGNSSKDKENNNTQQQSAVERLKVRIPSAPDGIKSTSSSANTNPAPSSTGGNNTKSESNNNPIRALIELNNGKTPGRNLEDALNELEDMYKSLRLSDEDLLDRAERRDLPTPHQELRDAPLIPIPQGYYRFEHLGSAESLGTGSGSAGTNYTSHSGSGGEPHQPRVRAPSVRRSSRPDTVSDDMANRRLAFPDGKPLDPRVVVAKTGSYLARSPAFSPCTSPCPPDAAAAQQSKLFSLALLGEEEPDVTLDDVSFRNYKRANAIRIIDPQPPFGIPLGPITAAPANDYLHSKPSESYRPIFGHLKTPDVVNDDIAFRNLRKDLGQDAGLATKDWTPRLFSPNREASFNYPKVKDSKKLRAIRSLSANITHMLPNNAAVANRGSPTNFLHQHQQRYDSNIGKWNSYGDLHRQASAGSPSARASTYLQPSWVEQIEKVQTSTETLTDHRHASRLATAILDPPEHWERKFPKKTVELTPPIYDPEKPRRPWTDIILESFEREKQKEMERLAAEAAAANEAAASSANNKTEAKSELEQDELVADDDVFMDASDEASKSETAVAEQVKISGNSSKNNDPENLQQQQQARPNMDISLAGSTAMMLVRPLPLLSGQKTRRGSWVEPSRSYSSSAAFHSSLQLQDTEASGSPSTTITSHQQDKRRKSWSDLPKDIDSFLSSTPEAIMLSGSSCSDSPTRKLFNPLPPPKKIREINLEAFNNNSSTGSKNQADQVGNNLSSTNGLNNATPGQIRQAKGDNDGENSLLTDSTSDKVNSSSGKSREEDELNELMDQLLKDADACGQSIEEAAATPNTKMNDSARVGGEIGKTTDKDKSVSASGNSLQKEMKMDGETSSHKQSCKQDLSCTIVGIIPKQQSPPPLATVAKSSSPRLDLDDAASAVPTAVAQGRKVLKIDNSNEKGNVASLPKERNALSSSDPSPILGGRSKVAAETASSIEDLIESINETLPELEASCGGESGGGSGSIGMITSSSHSSDGKPNGSSSASGSPASSIPSPSPGSPTPAAVLSVSLVKKDAVVERESFSGGDLAIDDDHGRPLSPSSSAFPVPAKRRHLPGKGAEESLYENLPAAMNMKKTGNDGKVCSSSPFPSSYKDEESESSSSRSDPYHVNTASKEKIPPLLTSADRKMNAGDRRALHDSNNDEDEDNEEEDVQHSSSHQPSSLSSNDSSDVSAAGASNSSSPRETDGHNKMEDHHRHHSRQQNDNANNIIREDNINEEQTGSSASPSVSLPSSVPFDAKNSSVSPFDNTASTTAFTNNPNNNETTTTATSRRMSSNNSNASSTSSSRETLFRKKSEGSLQVHPSEHHNDRSNSKTSQQQGSLYTPHARETGLISVSQRHQRVASNKNGLGRVGGASEGMCSKERETFIGNSSRRLASSSSTSSAAEEMGAVKASQGKRKEQQQQQPVARSRTTGSAAFTSTTQGSYNNGSQTKKCATSTALATPSAVPAETSASETGNGGMSFLRNNFPFFRSSTSRSRSQSVISDVSRSSETGDSKRERDKSYRRKSHLNRAFTDEPVPDNCYNAYDAAAKSSKPASQDASSVESSAVEESRANHKPAVKLHPAIPSVLTSNKSDSNLAPNKSISRNNSYSQNESIPSPVPTNSHKSSPVVKKDSFSDAEGVSFIKKMLQKEGDRDRAAAAAEGGNKQNSQNGCTSIGNSNGSSAVGYNIKKSPSAGNQSYWSKFSSSQSAFLRKLFEKPKVSESQANNNLNKTTVQKADSSANCALQQTGTENCNGEKDFPEKENAEPVLGFSVAQKASFFMKLEHEQRFSKWRKNSVDLGVISSVTTPTYLDQPGESSRLNVNSSKSGNEVKPKSRFLSRPITPSEGNGTGISSNNGENMEFGSLPRIWRNHFQQSLESNASASTEKMSKNEIINPTTIPTSSCTDYDDKLRFEPKPANINRFPEISTTRDLEPISPYTIEPTVKSYSLTRSGRHTGNPDKAHQNNLASFPMYHSASAIINPTATTAPSLSASGKHSSGKPSMKFYKNVGNAYSSSSSSFSEAMSRNNSTKYLPSNANTKNGICSNNHDPPTVFENSISSSNNDKRRGSASDLELSGAAAANQSPLLSRSEKVKSMFISRNRYHCDTDNLSEDGEVSSGGQEVADIICRSYENSPVFRKKNWRTPKHAQSNFTKEIWRRCGNYENWNHRTQPQQHQRQQPQHPVPQTFTATTNVIEVTTIPPTLPSVAASPPPATSNLLQILTVLSSSNDELNEPKPKSKKHSRQGSREKVSGASSRPDSIPPIHPNHTTVIQPRVSTANCYTNSIKNPMPISGIHRHTMPPVANSDEVFVSVPHPEDEAFQSFFCSVKSYTQITHFPPANGVIVAPSCNVAKANNEHAMQMQRQHGYVANGLVDDIEGIQEEEAGALDISSVRRESDLLVMKKNVPTCKRKSTGGKYKNPLRALAARMDFRQQGYTQAHSTNSNMVHCSSDVDVST